METKIINTEDLRLARIKYYDVAHNGAELSDIEAYAFLKKTGDRYVNVFDILKDLPVLDRSIYPNVMRNGEEFGNRLIHVCGELKDGPCYVIEPFSMREVIGFDYISEEELKEFVLRSDKFFVDRIKLIEEETGMKRIKLQPVLKSDVENMQAFQEYMNRDTNVKTCSKSEIHMNFFFYLLVFLL